MKKNNSVSKYNMWNIDKLIPYINNPRINDHAVAKIAGAIKEFGFKIPIIAKEDGTIIDGHLRYKAAKKLDLKEVPVIIADDLTDAQIKAFRISVNKMADLAIWDNELLKIEFESLKELEFDLELTGFELNEINNFNLDSDDNFIPDLSDEDNDSNPNKKYNIIVTLENEMEQQDLFDDLTSKGYKVKVG